MIGGDVATSPFVVSGSAHRPAALRNARWNCSSTGSQYSNTASRGLPGRVSTTRGRKRKSRARSTHSGYAVTKAGVDSGGLVAVQSTVTGCLVQTGDVVRIELPSREDAHRMKDMLDIQWACIRIASMSGAAGNPSYTHDPDDDNDDDDAAAQLADEDVGGAVYE